MSFAKANSFFNMGRYSEALDIYKELSDIHGYEVVELSIKKCEAGIEKEKLAMSKAKSVSQLEKETLEKDKPELPFDKLYQKDSVLNAYFDHIYVVNLKHDIKSRLTTAQHLKEYGVNFEVFEAINGNQGEALEVWNNYRQRPVGELKRYPQFRKLELWLKRGFIESAGAVGYIFTYIKILRDAKKKGYKRFLILEDDILLSKNFEHDFKDFTSRVDSDWKVLLLGASQYGWEGIDNVESLKSGFYLPRRIDGCATCGSFAIGLDYSIIDELIEAAKAFEAPFDHLTLGELYERHISKCFVAYPNIVIADVSESSIRGKRSQIEHSKKVKWQLESFSYPLVSPSLALIVKSKKNLKYFSNFSSFDKQPFNLRVYINTEDGIRPVHNIEILDKSYNKISNNFEQLELINTDYIVTADENTVISESDLVEFIEFKTGIRNSFCSALIELKQNYNLGYVKGRASVIIPTHKRMSNLENAIKSVVSQDYHDLELIVVSDNGNSNPIDYDIQNIINRYVNSNDNCNIKFIAHKNNRNGSAARNTGLFHSTGEYISFLDDDDAYLPSRISKVINKLANTPHNIGAVYCGFLGWNSGYNNLKRYTEGDLTEYFLTLDYPKYYLHTNTATYKRSAILNINGFDESYRRHQDLEFNIRFFQLFEVSALKELLVQLKPEVSESVNALYNSDMIQVKNKFLNEFSRLIQTYPDNIQQKIYDVHFRETLRMVRHKDKVIDSLTADESNMSLRVLYELMKQKDIPQ